MIPIGKGVGGGSLINGMLWNRGNRDDFDAWVSFGNEGWGWYDLLPYFKKVHSLWIGISMLVLTVVVV